MVVEIVVHYRCVNGRWEFAVTGRGARLTGSATELLGARRLAHELIESLVPAGQQARSVRHLLDGDALAFSLAYLAAQRGAGMA